MKNFPLTPLRFTFVVCMLLFTSISAGHGAVLAAYDMATSLNASSSASGLTATALTTQITNNTGRAASGGNVFVRVQATPNTEALALDNNTYWQCNLQSTQGMNLESLTFTTVAQAPTASLFSGTIFVRSSADGYSSNIASYNHTSGQAAADRSINLTGSAYQNLNDVTFRFYFYDDSNSADSTAIVHRFSNIVVNGSIVPEPQRMALLLLGASAFLIRRRRH